MPEAEAYVLFITGYDPRAVKRARQICKLVGKNTVLRIIELEAEAEVRDLIATPTLMRLSPEPKRQVTGDLSDVHEIAAYLSGPWRPPLASEG